MAQTNSGLFRPILDRIGKKKRLVTDTRAAALMAAHCVHASWTQVRHPWRHTRAFQELIRQNDEYDKNHPKYWLEWICVIKKFET